MRRFCSAAALGAAVLLSALSIASCRRKDSQDPEVHGFPGPKPSWSVPSASVLEGGILVVTLNLTEVPDDPHVVELESSDLTRATVPATVTFPTGSTSLAVTITTIADSDNADSTVTIRAVNFDNVTSSLPVTLIEDDAVSGAGLGPVPAGTNRALMCGPGADAAWSTADDVLRVVSNLGVGAPIFADVIVGAISPGPHALPVVTGVMDTAVVLTNGPDLLLGTSDDALVEVGTISGTPSMTSSIAVGRMESSSRCRPVMVGPRAVIAMRGADLITNADDGLVVVDGLGTGALSTSFIGVDGIGFEDPSQPVPFDASILFIHTAGLDGIVGTADDVVRNVTGIGGAPFVGTIGVGTLPAGPIGIPVVVSASAVAWVDAGGDGIVGTADDGLIAITGLPGAPIVNIGFVVGPVSDETGVRMVATGGDAVLVPRRGLDLVSGTPDDDVALVTGISAGLPFGGPTALAAARSPGAGAGQIVVLSSTAAVRHGMGPDALLGTADDELILMTALTTAPASAAFAAGPAILLPPLATSATSAAFAGAGPDATAGSADDRIVEVSGIGAGPTLAFTQPGPVALAGPPVLVPLASGFVVCARTVGADGAPGTADDTLNVFPIP
jgi:hypothetical protein